MSLANQRTDANGGITRRRVLGGTLAGTAALAAIPRPTTATTAPVDVLDRDVVADRIRSRRYIEDVAALERELLEDGWEPRDDAAIGHRAPPDGGGYDVVVVPFRRPGTEGDAVLLWADTDDIPNQARRFEPVDGGRIRMRTTLPGAYGPVSSVATGNPAIWWYFCSNVNWACLFSIAGAWAGTIAGCGACLLDPSRLTCIACVGAAMSATGATLGCSVCDG